MLNSILCGQVIVGRIGRLVLSNSVTTYVNRPLSTLTWPWSCWQNHKLIIKLQTLILWTGIGIHHYKQQYCIIYGISLKMKQCMDVVDVLWVYGLVQFTDITVPLCNNTQKCVEVHAVISQYIIEFMNSNTVYDLLSYGGLGTSKAVYNGLFQQFKRCYGLKFAVCMFKNCKLPCQCAPYLSHILLYRCYRK